MTHADINDLETKDYVFKIGDRGKAIQARYDENTDALIFPRAVFEYVYKLLTEALSQVSEIKENIIKYMKKYPNHVGNTDFWEGFYACRNVVLQLDDEEYAPKEQEPCDDAISREAVVQTIEDAKNAGELTFARTIKRIMELPPVTQKSGKWIDDEFGSKCSCCGIHTHLDKFDRPMKFKYCSMCGAKMESEDKE